MIKLLKNKEIDKEKWDKKVACAHNEILYAYSWYLDLLSPNWSALVWDDYRYIMPLPGKRKYGIPYLFQPPLTQQLGIFSEEKITSDCAALFLKNIPRKFLFVDLHLNSENNLLENAQFAVNQRITHHLSLRKTYETIYKGYNQNTKRNLKKAVKAKLRISTNKDCKSFFEFWEQHSKLPEAKQNDLLKKIVYASLERNCGELLVAFDENQEPTAVCFFVLCQTKLIYLVATASNRGKEIGASFALIDSMIQKYATQKIILDFEGSMLPGVAQFYKGFGSEEQKFLRITRSICPLFKKS